jgi:3-isopropylmalate/(R)-2-methylmalate dehydratase large subunit
MSAGRTLSQKILDRKAGVPCLPGAFARFRPDLALANDITAPVAIAEFERHGGRRVHDPRQLVLVPDHFVPNKDIRSAEHALRLRRFATAQKIDKYFEVGRMGIEHVLLPEEGLVKSGDLVVGADSHTCTYGALGAFATGVGSTDVAGVYLTGQVWLRIPEAIRVFIAGRFGEHVSGKDLILRLIAMIGVDGANYQSLEFCGPGLAGISMENRLTVSNMAIEAGAKVGLFPVDEVTVAYEAGRGVAVEPLAADADAGYCRQIAIDLNNLPLQVAYPDLPSNARDIAAAERDQLAVDQVVIGSCTNGRIEDLRAAAAILKGKKVHPQLRCLVIPGSQRVVMQALQEGLIEIFIAAGCAVSTPTCGPCLGGHMGILAAGERALATTNRNFTGRMGHVQSEVFLSGPAVAAATAVAGRIVHPANV